MTNDDIGPHELLHALARDTIANAKAGTQGDGVHYIAGAADAVQFLVTGAVTPDFQRILDMIRDRRTVG
jgi:hypothetical protein